MQLDINQSISGGDLARLIEGDSGTYLAQNGAQSFVVVSSPGHSIKSIRAVGTVNGVEQWQLTKISSQDVSEEQNQPRTFTAGQQR